MHRPKSRLEIAMGVQNKFKDLTGQKFGSLTVIKCINRAYRTAEGKLISTLWLCKCDCGGEARVTSSSLKADKGTKSCGCLQKKMASEASLHDLSGMRFGRLLVLCRGENRGKRNERTTWKCLCDCGNFHETNASTLIEGRVTSCGCYNIELCRSRGTHFLSDSPEYEVWSSIKKRCYDVNADSYQYYGALGISMCDRWLNSFENFYADMGPRPSEYHSIEREKVGEDYCPENCHWGDPIEQANNKTTTVFLTFMGRTQGVKQWCRELDLTYKTVYARVHMSGWSTERALTTPTNGGFVEDAAYLLR